MTFTHWRPSALPCYRYDRLFNAPVPGAAHADGDFLKDVNPDSLQVEHGFVEPSLAAAARPPKGAVPTFQFQRVGFFAVDSDSTPAKPVFNRVVALKEDKEKGKL